MYYKSFKGNSKIKSLLVFTIALFILISSDSCKAQNNIAPITEAGVVKEHSPRFAWIYRL